MLSKSTSVLESVNWLLNKMNTKTWPRTFVQGLKHKQQGQGEGLQQQGQGLHRQGPGQGLHFGPQVFLKDKDWHHCFLSVFDCTLNICISRSFIYSSGCKIQVYV